MVTAEVIPARCIGCRLCTFHCEGMEIRSGVLAYVADPNKMEGIEKAAEECPGKAIVVKKAS